MPTMAFISHLLLSLAVIHLSTANHCKYNLTKADQVIDIDQSKGLSEFDDIGALHVDGKTVKDRMEECVEICCHAGAGCNIVSLDTAVTGPGGDNCHLYKCDPPESCKWTVKNDTQSALIYVPETTTLAKSTTPSPTTANDPEVNTTESELDDDKAKPTTESPEDVTSPEASDMLGNTTMSLPENNTLISSNGTEGSSDNSTESMPTEPTATNSTIEDVSGNKTVELTTASALDMETSTIAPSTQTSTTNQESTTVTTTTISDALEKSTPTSQPLDTNKASTYLTSGGTTAIFASTKTSQAPSTSTLAYDFDNSTVTPSSLRAKTADMSTTMVTTLALALAAGAMFIGIVATLIGKRAYDNWHRRHYQQIDYLVDGMYGS